MPHPQQPTHDIMSCSAKELADWLAERDIKAYRTDQILRWIYQRGADTFSQMTDLKKALRKMLAEHFHIQRLQKKSVEKAGDGTRKYLFRLFDDRVIETVWMPFENHQSLCISSQTGCAMGCRFCLTGKSGPGRNLYCGEILAQIREVLKDVGDRRSVRLVFMGMGEPLANYDNLSRALTVLTDSATGFGFSGRRITVSTVGIPKKIIALNRDFSVDIAVSLNAADNPTRSRLMPVNQKYPMADIIAACRKIRPDPQRPITFEYVLLKGVNDRPEDAAALCKLLGGIACKINLIPFNPHPESNFLRPDSEAVAAFQKILRKHRNRALIRDSRGADISAACGQLGRKATKADLL